MPSEGQPAETAAAESGVAATKERPPSKLVKSPLDPDAAWAKKGGRRYFGYKVHVGSTRARPSSAGR
jgi:hypothetical protein